MLKKRYELLFEDWLDKRTGEALEHARVSKTKAITVEEFRIKITKRLMELESTQDDVKLQLQKTAELSSETLQNVTPNNPVILTADGHKKYIVMDYADFYRYETIVANYYDSLKKDDD